MNKIMIALFVLCAAVAMAQSASTADLASPLPVALSPVTYFFPNSVISTPTITIASDSTTAVSIGTLPAGTKGVWVSTDVAVNFGNASCTLGTNWPTIAAGGTKEFIVSPLDTTPTIYFSQRAGGSPATIRLSPYK